MLSCPADSPLQPVVAMSHCGSVDSNVDLDEYFASYVPLSNLPTPPSVPKEDDPATNRGETAATTESDLSGPAAYLARLVPSNVSVRQACPSTVHAYLLRSGLPFETIALAACLLDALSFRFAKRWREACSSLPSTTSPLQQETIVLAALSIATSVHDDRQWRAVHWTRSVAGGACSTATFNRTTWCMLQDLDYSIHSFTPDMVEQALQAMRRIQPHPPLAASAAHEEDEDEWFGIDEITGKPKPRPLNMTGLAVEHHGLMTPEPDE